MSFNIEAVRKYYQDPHLQLIRELSKRIAAQEVENVEIETDDITGLGDYDHSYVRYTDRWNFIKKFTSPATDPQLPMEPDYDHLALDLKFDHFGNTLTDYSGFGNHAEIYGEPCPASGIAVPYRGGVMKSVAHEFDHTWPTYYKIPDHEKLRVVGKTVGHSMWFVFNLKSVLDNGGVSQTLYNKVDDASNGLSVRVDDAGAVVYLVERAGTHYGVRTANNSILPNTDYEMVVNYAVSGNIQHVYLNNVDKSLNSSAATITDNADHSAFVGARPTENAGFLDNNFLQHVRFYDEYVISTAQVGYLFANKFTVSNIAAGNVFIFDGTVFGD